MTEKELAEAMASREWTRMEWKESFGAECVETACAFANAGGGYIVVGVTDDGGLAQSPLRAEALRDCENRIATSTEPSVAVDAERVPYRGGEVLVLKVAENPLKPVAVKGRCLVRKGSVNHRMTPAEIAECHLKTTGTSMDAVPVPGATKEDLDMEAVRRYMRAAVETGRRSFSLDEDPWGVLKKLEWVKSETEISRAAYLLFAKDPQLKFPQAIVHAGAFRDGGALILDSFDARGNIQDQIDATLAFVRRNIRRSIVVTAKAKHDRFWEYPLEALRETLTNAVCHRDYGLTDDIQLKILEDRLIVYSPGQLPFDMSLTSLLSEDHPSRPRNKLIAQAFYDIHLIEHYGSGIRRIKNDCDRNGNPYPQWNDGPGMFSTTYFPRGADEKTKTDSANGPEPTNEPINTANEPINGRNEPINGKNEPINEPTNPVASSIRERVLDCVRQHPGIKRDDIAKTLDVSLSTARRALESLGEAIEYRGSKKTGGYFPVGE